MTILRNAALVLALAGAAATTHAGVKASAVNATYLAWAASDDVTVPLNSAGATTLSFKLGSAGKKVLTYSAECGVGAPEGDADARLHLDIYLNGVIVPPTGTNYNSFCSAKGTYGFPGYVRTSITVPIEGIAGNNTVQIKARGGNGALYIYLGNSALVIYD